VYYQQAQPMALAELEIASRAFESACSEIEIQNIAEISYLSFQLENRLTENDLHLLSRLSFAFALFELVEHNRQECLIPIPKVKYEYVSSKISSLLKYQGKTNELFTKMMINVALLSSDYSYDESIQLLDPIAGRGTTLFEAAVYGFDAFGIELEANSVHEASVFFKKFLEREKYKHLADKRRVGGNEKSDPIFIQEFEYAQTKNEFKKVNATKKLGMVTGNTLNADKYFKSSTFHILVGDLPYGVAHGNVANKKQASITRSPAELLANSLAQWYKVLKKGGVLVMAWNIFVLPKEEIIALLLQNNFEVFTESPYDQFEHRVDNAIKRDIVVAKKV
jgi:SAM-dependent methyltransferase